MKFSTVSKFLVSGLLVAGYAVSPQAYACASDTPDTWECVDSNANHTFTGTVTLDYLGGLVTAVCDMEFVGNASISGNRAYINVLSANITTSSGTCGRITVSGTPWQAYESGTSNAGIPGASGGDIYTKDSGDAAVGDIGVVTVTHDWFGTLCSGNLPGVMFRNNAPGTGNIADPSHFIFNSNIGNCGISGTVYSTSDINAW